MSVHNRVKLQCLNFIGKSVKKSPISEEKFAEALLHAIGRRFLIGVLQLYTIGNTMLESFEISEQKSATDRLRNARIQIQTRLDAHNLRAALKRFDAGVRRSLRETAEEEELDELKFSRIKHLYRLVNEFVHVSPARRPYENFHVWATKGIQLFS